MDRKLESFLTVCRTMNYREAARQMHLTQPAISKQIQALENEFGTKLFRYDGRKLSKTEKGAILESYAISLEYNYRELELAMQEKKHLHLHIGATKTIGDYVIGPAVIRYLKDPDHELSLIVDNTVQLMKLLDENRLDFAIIEGIFDKKKYEYRLYRNEPFFGICAANYPNKEILKKPENQDFPLEDLFGETIIVREKGSGTRELFERDLESRGYSLQCFSRIIELSSFQLIRQAVREGLGISFVYASVIKDEENLRHFYAGGIQKYHEFNIVCLSNTSAHAYAERFLEEAKLIEGE